MEVRLLGPLEVFVAGRVVHVTSPKQRIVLATLALRANHLVPAEDLIDRLWDGAPPPTGRATLHNHVMRLRRLTAGPDAVSPVRTRSPGYVLDTEPDTVDVQVAQRLFAEALRARHAGDAEAEAELLRAAIEVWRGPALLDIPSERMRREDGAMWTERWAQAVERRIEVDLARGRHAEVIGELRALVRAHPLREGLRGHLMLALHGSGRRAEALDAYAEARRELVAQLGVEPGTRLRELHATVLAAHEQPAQDQPVTVRRPAVRPAELPRDVPGLAGRRAALDRLDAGLSAGLLVISGIAGVGKTALAVHWAHATADRFPDGQLYLDLRGFDPQHEPLPPALALPQLLRRLGVDAEQVAGDLAEQTTVYRSLLSNRRCLLVLDNARSAEQVRPLLPGGIGCATVITSRNRLGELVAIDGAVSVPLDVLSDEAAVRLLTDAVPAGQVAGRPAALPELARLCGRLPLALRIAAANLICHPHTTVAELVAALSDGAGLGGLTVDGAEEGAVAKAFGLSYASLPADQRRLFRLLGLVPGPDFTPASAAAITGASVATAARLLTALAAASLVEQHQPGRYRLHDLLRRFAVDRVALDEPPHSRAAALIALFDHYLDVADAASRRLNPDFTRLPRDVRPAVADLPDADSAVDWFAAERANLVAAVEHAADHGPWSYAWYLADALRSYFHGSVHVSEWRLTAMCGMRAARAAGDRRAQAGMELTLAAQAMGVTDFPRAIGHLHRALDISVEVGWERGEWAATNNLGTLYEHTGRPRQALPYARRSAEFTEGLGAEGGEATANGVLGQTYWGLGQLANAAACLRLAGALVRQAGNEVAAMRFAGDLGFVLHDQGLLDEAEQHLVAALASYRRFSSPVAQADVLSGLSRLRCEAGDLVGALARGTEALDLARRFSEAEPIAIALDAVAGAHHAAGSLALARKHRREAVQIAERAGTDAVTVDALTGLSADERELGDHRAAVAAANRARAISRRTGSLLRQIRAETALAQAYRRVGNVEHALRWTRHALDLAAPVGARLVAQRLTDLLADLTERREAPAE
ncbi:transcriptional regulator [Solihabitans fulvus]|uniref:Transcriptional regulator n=1 Tax=Solihabitans fulvus TaxID=1892852 RepID=A0A5B2XCY9_9PSEU|nr:BTAD domain-containing putative transcriptional regulator [Solihabitans fulvus]KAA2261598.1 transcriptional regulator [Solihabitans fulvus]